MLNLFFLFALGVSCCSVKSYDLPEKVYYDLDLSENLFKSFIIEHHKQYTTNEAEYRFQVFRENLKWINDHNKNHENTVFGVTPFSDLTHDEFEKEISCFNRNANSRAVQPVEINHKDIEIPEELDYRTHNLVTAVKDQSICGSCYIFGAVGEIEGQYAKKHKELVMLSEGYPLDCNDNFTCDGGDPVDVMNWLAGTTGELKYSDCPYIFFKFPCKKIPNKKGFAKVKGGKSFSVNSTDDLKKELVNHGGPLAIGLYASRQFKNYIGGVLNPSECTGHEKINHAVVLVGYGKYKGEDYWLIKNSWSDSWGEKGYVRLAVNKCGVGSYVATSEVE